jgi:hypothetical protein
MVEHLHGKQEVPSSNPSTVKKKKKLGNFSVVIKAFYQSIPAGKRVNRHRGKTKPVGAASAARGRGRARFAKNALKTQPPSQ